MLANASHDTGVIASVSWKGVGSLKATTSFVIAYGASEYGPRV